MSFGDIVDEDLLVAYEIYLREDVSVAEFRGLVQLAWNRNSYGANRKFSFDLTVSAPNKLKLLSAYTINYQPAESITASIDLPVPEDSIRLETTVALVTPSLKRTRMQKKTEYTPGTLAKYSKDIESKLLMLLGDTLKSSNDDLRQQVLKNVVSRLEERFEGFMEREKINNDIVDNIKHLVTSMTKYGRNDREQIRFKESLSLAISGKQSYQRLIQATGLSRRQLENGRKMREEFEIELKKAVDNEINAAEQPEDNIEDEDGSEVDSDVGSDEECDDSDEDNLTPGIPQKKKRANNGDGKAHEHKNIFRFCFLSKSRKVRTDAITGEIIQSFCHHSQWGGRVDTLKLAKQPVIVEQPRGGFEYEPMRSYQYTPKEMYTQFKESEYGARQRNSNNGRNLSLRRFRELICPCMTKAKQRDTADQTVAEFKQCLQSWDGMRKKDNNVRASIARCMTTECSLHKPGSNSAALYTAASKTTTSFLNYLLCPKIHRDELAVHVIENANSTESFAAERDNHMRINIEAAEARKVEREINFKASCARKGNYYIIQL